METHPVEQRRAFVEALVRGTESMSELCAQAGVSRKTGYKWKERFEAEGWAGLQDRPPVAHRLPHRTLPEVEGALVALKQERPRWGPKKLVTLLAERHPELDTPAASTAGEILKRHGLVSARPCPAHRSPIWRTAPLRPVDAPNATWSADFKGHFRLGDGSWCYPLTISDQFSRYLLRCQAMHGIDKEPARRVFEAAFREFGLPTVIRTDNGTPFASNRGCLGLSELSLWWLRLGICPERIQPGCPQQNGRHERLHRTLAEETTRPPAYRLGEQQARFVWFRRDYNQERPHEALGQRRPASLYTPSLRPMPARLPDVEYADGLDLRRVDRNGSICFGRNRFFISKALTRQNVGLRQVADDALEVWIGPLAVGYIDLSRRRLVPYEDTSRHLEEAVGAETKVSPRLPV
jgi:transposase InsO family protein